MPQLIGVVETQAFAREASAILDEQELDELKDYLAENPEAGVIIPASGGVRKIRWAASGRGKRGGARIIYYYHSLDLPLFLISIFAKSKKSDLDPAELKAAKKFAETIVKEHEQRK